MTKRKRMCRKCNRRMVVEYENHEACTNPTCAYYLSYELSPEEQAAFDKEDLEVVFGNKRTGEITKPEKVGHDFLV